MKITKKTLDRFLEMVPKFQKILTVAKSRDLNESDTVTVITDILADVFGYEKYVEITSELAIRGTYCDIAVKINEKFQYLIECKAIGTELKDVHLRQAIGYGSNKGIQWVILTNSIDWQIYRIRFEQPIAWDLVARFDMLACTIKDEKFLDDLFLVSKEGVEKTVRDDLYEKIQCVNRFVISAIIQTEPVISCVRKELKKFAEGIRIDDAEILAIIRDSVLRRDLVEGDEAKSAWGKVVKNTKTSTPPQKRETTQAKVSSTELPAVQPQKSLSASLLEEAVAQNTAISDPTTGTHCGNPEND